MGGALLRGIIAQGKQFSGEHRMVGALHGSTLQREHSMVGSQHEGAQQGEHCMERCGVGSTGS